MATSPVVTSYADDGSNVTPNPARTIPTAEDMKVASYSGTNMRPIEANTASTMCRTLLSRSIRINGCVVNCCSVSVRVVNRW